jgi:hypothetical protein
LTMASTLGLVSSRRQLASTMKNLTIAPPDKHAPVAVLRREYVPSGTYHSPDEIQRICCTLHWRDGEFRHDTACPTRRREAPARVVVPLTATDAVPVCTTCHRPLEDETAALCARCEAASRHDAEVWAGLGKEHVLASRGGPRNSLHVL